MPFDPPAPDTPAFSAAVQPRPELKVVALWLFGLCAMVLVMVTLGGATRLTGSGLSIMEWAPIMGTLPPLSDAEWQRLYGLYQHIPQYDLVNHGFGLAGFKSIFWLEWTHRLWGRLMGAVLLLPLLWFSFRGLIGRGLALRLVGLLILGGLQGAVGWFMVASGFDADQTAVNPYRLVMHLALAVGLYTALLWTALSVWRQARGPLEGSAPIAVKQLTVCSVVMTVVTILAGGFVAGLHAGLTYNSFPLMDGHIVPEGYSLLHPFLRNLFENVAAVQFDHRLLATLTATLTLVTAAAGLWRARGPVRTAMAVLGSAVLMQYALGVTTLLWVVPVSLGTAHQGMAMLLLTAGLVAVHAQRSLAPSSQRAPRRPAPALTLQPASGLR